MRRPLLSKVKCMPVSSQALAGADLNHGGSHEAVCRENVQMLRHLQCSKPQQARFLVTVLDDLCHTLDQQNVPELGWREAGLLRSCGHVGGSRGYHNRGAVPADPQDAHRRLPVLPRVGHLLEALPPAVGRAASRAAQYSCFVPVRNSCDVEKLAQKGMTRRLSSRGGPRQCSLPCSC